jgi:RNA polymerase sigma-70 factor (ECF subfamily)
MHPSAAAPSDQLARPKTATTDETSDETLLALFGQSDPAGSAAFIRRFERRIFGLALTIVGDSRVAEDVAQESLLKIWRHSDAFDARRGSVAAWALTITRNRAIDAVRGRRSITVASDTLADWSAPDRDPGDAAVVSDDVDRLRIALTRLPEEQRRAIVLAGVWGITAREIAQREGIPLGTAKTRVRTALQRLRDTLRDAPTP